MLQYEMDLMQERLDRESHPNKLFFCYANTVTTIDFAKKFKGHGWVGIKFQTEPNQEFNDIIYTFVSKKMIPVYSKKH
jgi:Holliday junction resolvase